jgi:hypothetical protein
LLLQVAHAFEQAAGLRNRRPELATVPPQIGKTLADAGLTLPASDMAGLGAVVEELQAGAAALRGPRSYANEPAATFQLPAGT